jgi:hypothetical protein
LIVRRGTIRSVERCENVGRKNDPAATGGFADKVLTAVWIFAAKIVAVSCNPAPLHWA